MRLLQAARSRGIVLDTYTAWFAHQIKVLDTLKALFVRVVVPRSSIDELRGWRERLEPASDEPLTTIGYARTDSTSVRKFLPTTSARRLP